MSEKTYTLTIEYEAGPTGDRIVNEGTGQKYIDVLIAQIEARIRELDINLKQWPYVRVKSLVAN